MQSVTRSILRCDDTVTQAKFIRDLVGETLRVVQRIWVARGRALGPLLEMAVDIHFPFDSVKLVELLRDSSPQSIWGGLIATIVALAVLEQALFTYRRIKYGLKGPLFVVPFIGGEAGCRRALIKCGTADLRNRQQWLYRCVGRAPSLRRCVAVPTMMSMPSWLRGLCFRLGCRGYAGLTHPLYDAS